jgi:hypothetical protein
MTKKPIKEKKMLAVSKLVSCKEFKRDLPKTDEVFGFPLPFPTRVGISDDGKEMIATHCVLQKQDDGSVISRFCFINDKKEICLINFSDETTPGHNGKTSRGEMIN